MVALANHIHQVRHESESCGDTPRKEKFMTKYLIARVCFTFALLLAVGSTIGGYIGAKIGRRLPPNGLRACIVVVSVVAFTVMMLR